MHVLIVYISKWIKKHSKFVFGQIWQRFYKFRPMIKLTWLFTSKCFRKYTVQSCVLNQKFQHPSLSKNSAHFGGRCLLVNTQLLYCSDFQRSHWTVWIRFGVTSTTLVRTLVFVQLSCQYSSCWHYITVWTCRSSFGRQLLRIPRLQWGNG